MILIALTGWGQEDDKLRAQRAGFDHHLTKPFDPSTLELLETKHHWADDSPGDGPLTHSEGWC
jgi:CheY-like chemotaxis protein